MHHILHTKKTFHFSVSSSLCRRGCLPEIQLTCRAIGVTQQDTWTEKKQGRCTHALSSLSFKKDSHCLALGFANLSLYVPYPPYYHNSMLIVMMLNEIFQNVPTKELKCTPTSQYEFSCSIAAEEAHRWCLTIFENDFTRQWLSGHNNSMMPTAWILSLCYHS